MPHWHENYQWQHDYIRLTTDTGFNFENHKTPNFDKAQISLLDIDRVIKERDIQTVEKCIPTIIHFILDPEQTELLDTSFVKTFRMSQLSIEYLLYCKKYLDNTVVLLKGELNKYKGENAELKEFVQELKNHIAVLMQKMKEEKGGSSSSSYKCNTCNKTFSTPEFLSSHKMRRHSVSQSEEPVKLVEEETDKLHMEIKELKGRLNSAEKLIQREQEALKSPDSNNSKEHEFKINDLEHKFEELRSAVESEMKLFQTQHSFEEKCEKWFGMALQNLKDDKGITKENVMVRVETTTQTEQASEATVETVEVAKSDLEVTQKQITEFGEALEIKVTTSLEKIENQMQSFWEKLNEIKDKPSSPQILEPPSEETNKTESVEINAPIIKPRTKYTITSDSNKKKLDPVEDKENLQEKNKIFSKTINDNNKPQTFQLVKSSNVQETNQLSDYGSSAETDSDSESESIELPPPKSEIRHSKVAATMKNKNVKNITMKRDQVVILGEMQNEIDNVLRSRLQSLGVSPDWNGLPFRSFQRALAIVNHQASLMKKTYPNFDTISKKIENDILNKLGEQETAKKIVPYKIKSKPKQNANLTPIPSSSRVEIKNRQLYETDSDSEPAKPKLSSERPSPYSAVINELKTVNSKKNAPQSDSGSELEIGNKIEEPTDNKKNEDHTKGVLKSYPSTGSLTKKKVLFNLQAENQDEVGKEGGSTTSIASSVLDAAPKENIKNKKDDKSAKAKEIEDISDFDLSEL